MSVIGTGLLTARGEHPVDGDEIAQNRVLGLLWVLERGSGWSVMTLPKDACRNCTRPIRFAVVPERFAGRWVHGHSGLPWCLLKRGEA